MVLPLLDGDADMTPPLLAFRTLGDLPVPSSSWCCMASQIFQRVLCEVVSWTLGWTLHRHTVYERCHLWSRCNRAPCRPRLKMKFHFYPGMMGLIIPCGWKSGMKQRVKTKRRESFEAPLVCWPASVHHKHFRHMSENIPFRKASIVQIMVKRMNKPAQNGKIKRIEKHLKLKLEGKLFKIQAQKWSGFGCKKTN